MTDLQPGSSFDAAPFGFRLTRPDGKVQGVRWAEPRKIRQVVVEFAPGPALPAPEKVRLQYWHRVWNGRPDPILAESGAGGVGWAAMDDWTNGGWKNADTNVHVDGRRWAFTFNPTGAREFENLGHPGVTYRRTLKVRLVSEEPLPDVLRFGAITDAVCQPLTVRIHFGTPAEPRIDVDGDDPVHLEVFNGTVLGVRPLGSKGALSAGSQRLVVPGGKDTGIEAVLITAVDPVDARYDRTIVTVRSEQRPFSFAADEVARGERILVDDLGVLVTRSDDPMSLSAFRQARTEFAGRTVYDRVFDAPEQTLARAWEDMPLKRPLYFVHGLPGNRNGMWHDPRGEVSVTASRRWFNLPASEADTSRKGWPGQELKLAFGFPGDQFSSQRELKDGYLPLLRTWWQDGQIHYEQQAILDKLDGDLSEVNLDDPTVLLMRIRVVNTSGSGAAQARLTLASWPSGGRDQLRLDGERLVATTWHRDKPGTLPGPDAAGEPQLRYLIKNADRGTITSDGDALRWSLDLAPGASHELICLIPSITLTEDDEIAALARRDFEADSRRVCRYWEEITARGTQITTPEPWLNGFYKAHLRHLLVNCYKEIGSDRLHAHVGTFRYGVYPDESCMMISDLDRRGYHDEARRCLESFLHYQGTVPMPGNFKSKEGLFYGAGGHDHGGYNKSHGWVLWNMAEHWRNTRDRDWMTQAAPKLVAACDWVIRERGATMTEGAGRDGGMSAADHIAGAEWENGNQNPPRERGEKARVATGKSENVGDRESEIAQSPNHPITQSSDRPPLQHGWLPTGSLEDVTDYWYWMVTNACTVWGFQALADALADFGHPEAQRLQREARAYRDDFLRGIEEARILTPVVRLRDGTCVPKYPSRLYERGRSHGWLRETLEGAIHLLITGMLEPGRPEAKWILNDFEDNLYISDDYGYAIPSFDRFWFSRGGFSMQANLLHGPLPYLYRDEIQHYVRAYFNGFASAFYPDIRMCNEHSLPELGYPAGDHFKSSDEAQSTFWLRLMFVHERGGDLYLGQAIPRYWLAGGNTIGIERAATYHGPMSLRIESRTEQGEIRATLSPPDRNPPGTIYLRLRHPEAKPMRSVTVNGNAHDAFDAKKEWIVLPGTLDGPREIVARY